MNGELISYLFRYINLGVVLGAGLYFFTKKMLPGIKLSILEKHNFIKSLSKKGQQLLKQQRNLEQELVAQDEEGKKLFDRINIWATSYQKKENQKKQENQVYFQRAIQRAEAQTDRKDFNRVRGLILTEAIQGAQKQLETEFAQEKTGRHFIASIIKDIGKEVA